MSFGSPREAPQRGFATVYQDLAMIPLMSVSRNFFLGSEPTKRFGPFKRYDAARADALTREELRKMGISIRDTSPPVGTLSGGEELRELAEELAQIAGEGGHTGQDAP